MAKGIMNKNLEENIKKLPKEILYQKYIIENKTYEEIQEEFNISKTSLYTLIKYYDIKKPKTLSNKIKRNSKEGVENRNKTLIEKYGSLDEYKKYLSDKCKDSWHSKSEEELNEHIKKIKENGARKSEKRVIKKHFK